MTTELMTLTSTETGEEMTLKMVLKRKRKITGLKTLTGVKKDEDSA